MDKTDSHLVAYATSVQRDFHPLYAFGERYVPDLEPPVTVSVRVTVDDLETAVALERSVLALVEAI